MRTGIYQIESKTTGMFREICQFNYRISKEGIVEVKLIGNIFSEWLVISKIPDGAKIIK